MSLKSVKTKIRSVDKTRQVTKAMEAVSAVKMRKSQEAALVARPYALAALKILKSVSASIEGSAHPLAAARPVRKTCCIVAASDRGLAGSLNSSVFRGFGRWMAERGIAKENVGVITVGRRGTDYFARRKYALIASYELWGDFVDFNTVLPLVEKVRELFLSEEYDDVWIVYTNFISTLRQEVFVRKILPLSSEGLEEAVSGIVPETGKYAELALEGKDDTVDTYTFEPDAGTVLNELIPHILKIQMYHSVLEANASEHSARMMAMKNASDNAGEILKDLRLSYNKVRQAGITKEVSEIVSGTLV